VRHGSLRLALKFSEALTQMTSVIAYAEFDNIIEIDRDRNLLLECDDGIQMKFVAHYELKTLMASTASTHCLIVHKY